MCSRGRQQQNMVVWRARSHSHQLSSVQKAAWAVQTSKRVKPSKGGYEIGPVGLNVSVSMVNVLKDTEFSRCERRMSEQEWREQECSLSLSVKEIACLFARASAVTLVALHRQQCNRQLRVLDYFFSRTCPITIRRCVLSVLSAMLLVCLLSENRRLRGNWWPIKCRKVYITSALVVPFAGVTGPCIGR